MSRHIIFPLWVWSFFSSLNSLAVLLFIVAACSLFLLKSVGFVFWCIVRFFPHNSMFSSCLYKFIYTFGNGVRILVLSIRTATRYECCPPCHAVWLHKIRGTYIPFIFEFVLKFNTIYRSNCFFLLIFTSLVGFGVNVYLCRWRWIIITITIIITATTARRHNMR